MVSSQTVSIHTDFISCGCSKTPHCLDWSYEDNIVAFGSSFNVCILKPEESTSTAYVTSTFCNHDANVTCVKFVNLATRTKDRPSSQILSCGGKKSVLWQVQLDDVSDRYLEPVADLHHSMSVTHACGFRFSNEITVTVTCGSDSKLKIWIVTKEGACEFQAFDYGDGFALCSDICQLDKDSLLIAAGTSSNKVLLYYQHTFNEPFIPVLSLTGHEDWIRDVKFCCQSFTDHTLMASCSQDKYTRVWKITRKANEFGEKVPKAATEDYEEIRLRKYAFSISENCTDICEVTLETVLTGHDGWIYSVCWSRGLSDGTPQLLTSSLDKSIIVWEPDVSSGVWLPKAQLGEIGGPVAGYYGAVFSPDAKMIVAHSFTGGLYCWKCNDESEWKIHYIPTGHSGPVEDLDWDPRGNYVLTCSKDQTTRLFAPWRRSGMRTTYAEIARPQIHGYDMQCLAIVNSFCFASGSEEKIIRSFVAPTNFVQNLCHFGGLDPAILSEYSSKCGSIEGASLPALGLSNKAVYVEDLQEQQPGKNMGQSADDNERYPLFSYQKCSLKEPPSEDHLAQNTLWPEVHKLYGHGYEVFCVASNYSGTVIASACKATKADCARILLWSTKDWQQKAQLEGHTLTVTQISFSFDDQYLLTVSRDRTWFLYRKLDNEFTWQKVACTDKKTSVHSRIIWGCSWSHDSLYFATVSRDNKLVIWNLNECLAQNVQPETEPVDTGMSAMCVAFATKYISPNCYLLGVGLEDGRILLFTWNVRSKTVNMLVDKSSNARHSLAVKKLKFKPSTTPDPEGEFIFASCSDDHSVKIHRIEIDL